MVRLKKPKLVSLPITELSPSGNGRGIFESKIVEVPFSMPGDTVKARMYRKRSGIYQSQLEELSISSPQRVSARCHHFAECGGCRLQHLSYEQQLQFKTEMVKNHFKDLKFELLPIIACEEMWYYRNKMEFTFSTDLSGNRYLGLIQDSSRGRVCHLQECLLTPDWYMHALKLVYEWWEKTGLRAYHAHRNSGSLRYLTLREGKRTGDKMIILTVSGEEEFALTEKQKLDFVDLFSSEPIAIFLRIQKRQSGVATEYLDEKLCGPEIIHERLNIGRELIFRISPSAFFQPNTKQAEQLYMKALSLAEIPEDGIVYDLYCGTGTISICAATKARLVVGIEINSQAIQDARLNAKENHLTNVTFLEGDVGKVLANIDQPPPDVVIVDPPRAGLNPEPLQNLINLNCPKIVYISCNPKSQAEDVRKLIDAGYQLTYLQPLDQVPHTPHIENIAVLVKGAHS